jgi:prepilin-type N-terminal cleavage/methylation domain-containing protein
MFRRFWQSERGFTLVEVMVTIIIMGVLATMAISLWWPVVESRRVDSATDQLAANLRQAHSRATNRLADQTVTLNFGQSEYTLPNGATADLDDNNDTASPAGDIVSVAWDDPSAVSTIIFKADGTAQITGGGSAADPIRVRATSNPGNFHRIEINPVTSEVKIVS